MTLTGFHATLGITGHGSGYRLRRPKVRISKCISMLVVAAASGQMLLAAVARASDGVIVLDQESPRDNAVINGGSPSITWQQGVVAGITGQLRGIEVHTSFEIGVARFFVNVGSPWQTDANDFETILSTSPGESNTWVFVDTSAANIHLEAGDTFVIGIGGQQGNLWFQTNDFNGYPDGSLWLNGSEFDLLGRGVDLAFRTYVEPARVGEGDILVGVCADQSCGGLFVFLLEPAAVPGGRKLFFVVPYLFVPPAPVRDVVVTESVWHEFRLNESRLLHGVMEAFVTVEADGGTHRALIRYDLVATDGPGSLMIGVLQTTVSDDMGHSQSDTHLVIVPIL